MNVPTAPASRSRCSQSALGRLPHRSQPNFLMANVNGLCTNTKQTELSLLLHKYNIHVAVLTETHLDENIPDSQIFQEGYKILRRDRNLHAVNRSKGGGIAMYMRNDVHYSGTNITVPEDLEVCWCILQPSQPESTIVAGVYIPPDTSASRRRALSNHIVETVELLRSHRPKAKIILLGDCNSTFDVSSLAQELNLKQIVTESTRGSAILDVILTDYNTGSQPSNIAAIGTSDHETVIWTCSLNKRQMYQYRTVRPLKESCLRHLTPSPSSPSTPSVALCTRVE